MSEFFSQDLAIKYTVRFCHMFTVCALSGKSIFEYLYGDFTNNSKAEGIFCGILGLILILSGLINTFLQKPKENLKEHKDLWLRILYAKFLITCLVCTPILRLLVSRETHIALQFYSILIMIIVSPLLRFYREYYTNLNKQTRYENMEIVH
ncbi:transmembrane protein, putative (macronuclear) [Tetrahymena thermophila SB210]|uniref:Transmembrane protein, putative n=1 Tax=Tetrahymena thermophila (strain SB210) TaxID=312017 RepID=A4VDF8_TETTS|nr:transmembrane protein, putative [Tetrahymena thermophila SB210]EDK31560.1 transmembrane protein, putative [Tetrahymena thermophila SB210]|eukprot:XP_001470874.1 transmembrane protein, putative [Tetrahymena thermophila SB210]